MAARKKSGRLTLRMDPDIHKRVAKAAKLLGMDINGLLNLIIRTHLAYYEMQAIRVGNFPEEQPLVQQVLDLLGKFSTEVKELAGGGVHIDFGFSQNKEEPKQSPSGESQPQPEQENQS